MDASSTGSAAHSDGKQSDVKAERPLQPSFVRNNLVELLTQKSARKSLQPLLLATADGTGCDEAALIVSDGARVSIVAASRHRNIKASFRWDFAAGYGADDTVFLDLRPGDNDVGNVGSWIAGRRLSGLARAPVDFAEGDFGVAIVCLRDARRTDKKVRWSRQSRPFLHKMTQLVGRQLAFYATLAAAVTAEVAIEPDRLSHASLEGLAYPSIVFDGELRKLSANRRFEDVLGSLNDAAELAALARRGRNGSEFVAVLFKRLGDPAFSKRHNPAWTLYRSTVDDRIYLCLSLRADPPSLDQASAAPETAAPETVESPAAPAQTSAVDDFLLETLLRRPRLHRRGALAYVTFRAWRKPIRAHQISALRAIKRHDSPAIDQRIAQEMREGIEEMVGFGAFSVIVPIPGGHSRREDALSVRIATQLGQLVGLPVVRAFAHTPLTGSSHPKANLRRPPLKPLMEVQSPAILIDDVATSGRHLEEAALLLRPSAGSVFAAAWIGGDAT